MVQYLAFREGKQPNMLDSTDGKEQDTKPYEAGQRWAVLVTEKP